MSGENRPPRRELHAACAACLELASHTLQREPRQADRDIPREMLAFLQDLRRQYEDALHQQGD